MQTKEGINITLKKGSLAEEKVRYFARTGVALIFEKEILPDRYLHFVYKP